MFQIYKSISRTKYTAVFGYSIKVDISLIANDIACANEVMTKLIVQTRTVKKNVGLPMIFWSVDTLDWKTKNVESTVNSILNAKDGDIILLHDIHKTSVDAAIEALPKLIEKGFQIVTVSELAEAKGQKLELGVKYFSF